MYRYTSKTCREPTTKMVFVVEGRAVSCGGYPGSPSRHGGSEAW